MDSTATHDVPVTLAERERERDAARHESWEREQTIHAKNRALEETEEIARQLAHKALAAKEHEHGA